MKRLALPSLLAGLLALAFLLPGCTRDPSESVRFMIWGAPEEIRVVQGYLDDFGREHPEIDVRGTLRPGLSAPAKQVRV